MGEIATRTLPRVLLSLISTLLLAFVIGYIGVSGFGGEPIGVEKASAYPGYSIEDVALNAYDDSSAYYYNWFVQNGWDADYWVDPQHLYAVYDGVYDACGGVLYPYQGPRYCSGDMGVYYTIPWDGNDFGDGAIAAVVAHEMGHHVQNLLGTLDMKARGQLYTVQTELQADCFAGAYMASAYRRNLLDPGDINEAYDWFGWGGDSLPVDDADHHGTPQERQDWFNYGWDTEDPSNCEV